MGLHPPHPLLQFTPFKFENLMNFAAVYNHWTGLDWTGLDWTTGLSLKLRACQYINTYNVFVQLINGAYSYAACPGIILNCH